MTKIILRFLFSFLVSCSDASKKPKDIIEETEMVSILADIHLFEAEMEIKSFSLDTLAWSAKSSYDTIFSRHHISKEKFLRTFKYYEDHSKEMDELYLKVVDELSKMEADLSGAVDSSLHSE